MAAANQLDGIRHELKKKPDVTAKEKERKELDGHINYCKGEVAAVKRLIEHQLKDTGMKKVLDLL